MFTRFGLRFRMAASYVLVSALAVLVVEAILVAVFVSRVHSEQDSILATQQRAARAAAARAQSKAAGAAEETAATAVAAVSVTAARQPALSDRTLLDDASAHFSTSGATPPRANPQNVQGDATEVARVLATADGQVVSGTGLATRELPRYAVTGHPASGLKTISGKVIAWAIAPVELVDPGTANTRLIGLAYVELLAPQPSAPVAAGSAQSQQVAAQVIGWLLAPGALIAALLVPVGALFGLFTTRTLIRRIQRLALSTKVMAAGDLRARTPASGADEISQLEQAFNVMAERLEHAVAAERDAAGSMAQRAERTRIARELHDSISQDLFSASLVATGLRKALPPGTKLQRQAESMELTLERTRREMRAMLMELRPVALETASLAVALTEMCRAYETQLGVSVVARIQVQDLSPPVEHATLRVVQEALGNAVRHGRPQTIDVTVATEADRVTITIRDDGVGFDPGQVAERHGMGLQMMRERVEELGGVIHVESTPSKGTRVRVTM
ncbi:MAG TPA: sensor histidine kinase [Streptosporangiaceae bacterium]